MDSSLYSAVENSWVRTKKESRLKCLDTTVSRNGHLVDWMAHSKLVPNGKEKKRCFKKKMHLSTSRYLYSSDVPPYDFYLFANLIRMPQEKEFGPMMRL